MAPSEDVKGLLQLVWSRILKLFAGTPPQTVALTGVFGLAVFLYGIYQFRQAGKRSLPSQRRPPGSNAASEQQRQQWQQQPAILAQQQQQQQRPRQMQGAKQQHTLVQQQVSQAHAQSSPVGADASLAAAVRAQLAGVTVITISAPGVLLQETEPHQLQDGATLLEHAAEIVSAMTQVANVFIMAHVEDEIGEATVRCALEGANLLGSSSGQVKPHRLLFCSTLEGKTSMVRQLEPGLHADASALTIEGLRRFMPQLLYIKPPQAPAIPSASNVGTAASLTEVFRS